MTDLRERVKLAILEEIVGMDTCIIENAHKRAEASADAVLAIARPAIIEEAVAVVELHGDGAVTRSVLDDILAAIRKLAEKPR